MVILPLGSALYEVLGPGAHSSEPVLLIRMVTYCRPPGPC